MSPASIKTLIVRHGRTEANASGLLLGRADPPLDPVGHEQARQLGEVIGDHCVILTSPLQRCCQTAQAIADYSRASTSLIVEPRLIEIDYGQWDLQPLTTITADQWNQWRSDLDFRPPGGESFGELFARVSEVLDELSRGRLEGVDQDLDPGAKVVLVTHVSPIKMAVAWALGVGPQIAWRTHVTPASVTTISLSSGRASLHGFNWSVGSG